MAAPDPRTPAPLVARGDGDISVEHRHLRPLTSLRFVAAAVVFVHHALFFAAQELGRDTSDLPYLWDLASQGALGVSFFFVLSGFILTWNYHDRFRTLEPVATMRFWIARVGRIWPVHAVTFVLACGFFVDDLLAAPITTLLTGLANLGLVHGFIPLDGADGVPQSFNAPSWSLSCELCFYAMFPLLAWAFVRLAAAWRGWLLVVPGTWWALTLLTAVAFGDDPMAEWFLYTYPVARLGDFLAGICCGLAFVALRRARGPRLGWGPARWTLAEAAVLGALGGLVALSPLLPHALTYSALYLPVMVAFVLVAAGSDGAGARLLSHPFLVHLGEISFSFYMLHWLVMAYGQRLDAYALGLVPAFAAMFVATALASALLHRVVELPMRDRIRARGDRWLVARGSMQPRAER